LTIGAAIVKVCLTADGKIESTRLIKTSGVPAYDDQLQAAIRDTWAFDPVDGHPVCTAITFLAR
jgi:outer membrane biosynthesis protein TonB